jgi:hypothetical protein
MVFLTEFLNLNINAKREMIQKLHNTLGLLITALYLNHPQLNYMRGLLDISRELVELVFLNDDTHFPIIKANGEFLKILSKYNELQKKEELFLTATREHKISGQYNI